MKKIVILFLLLQSFYCFSRVSLVNEASRNPPYPEDKFSDFRHKAIKPWQILDEEDLAVIDVYYRWFFSLQIKDQMLNPQQTDHLGWFLATVRTALIQNKIPKKYFPKLLKMFIAAHFFSKSNFSNKGIKAFSLSYLEPILLLEYAQIEDAKQADAVLEAMVKGGLLSRAREELDLLLSYNRFDLIRTWERKDEIRGYNHLLPLLARRELIIKSMDTDIQKFAERLIDDYRLNIEEVFSAVISDQRNDRLLFLLQQNDWLLLQMHKHKETPEIKRLLKAISDDWLIFNSTSLLESLPPENGEKIFKQIHHELDIFLKVFEINEDVLVVTQFFAGDAVPEDIKPLFRKHSSFVEKKLKSLKGYSNTGETQ